MHRVLVIDDDKAIVRMLSDFLKIYEFDVVTSYSGESALNKLDNSISLILLDINMNGINGIELCKIFRQKTNIPIIFLTANSTQCNKVLGFGVGADDYVTKPFDPIELIARVQALIRRYSQYDNISSAALEIIEFGNIRICKRSHIVYKNEKELNLTLTEFNLLIYLINNANTVLTRKQILNNVWKNDLYDENTVTTYIKRIREKIEDDKAVHKYIKSVRSIGYLFDANIKRS